MKKNIILGFLLTLFMMVGVNAQDKDSKPTEAKHECKDDACKHSHSFAPQKGDFTAAMLFGRGAYIGSSFSVPSSYSGSTVDGGAPYVGDISANSNSVTNMIGGEFRYYVGNKTALKFSGGAILRNTPYVVNTPGVYDNVNDVWIICTIGNIKQVTAITKISEGVAIITAKGERVWATLVHRTEQRDFCAVIIPPESLK